MDDTQLSRSSDAAATRKRLFSILKSQKPTHTPFSELEFNVATPMDSAKSRHVSFSRRTGVAEFVTNEASTTWKSFYEEDNESSGSKQAVGYLGKRAFDLQFEEMEADFIGTLNTGPNINISSSLCNLEQQLASSSLILEEQAKNAQAKITDQRTIVFENDACDISITQAVPNQVIQEYSNLLSSDDKVTHTSETATKRKTIILNNDDFDISVTQAVPLNQVICAMRNEERETAKDLIKNTDVTKTNKRRTVVFENDDAEMSTMQAVPIDVIHNVKYNNSDNDSKTELSDKHRTVIFEYEDADVSITQASNQVFVKVIHNELEDALNEALHNKNAGKSRRTIVFDKENDDVSISQNLQDKDVNITLSCQDNVIEDAGKTTPIVFDSNICMSQELPANIIETEATKSSPSKDKDLEIHDVSMTDMNIEDKDAKQDEITIRKSLNPESKLDKSVTNSISNLSMKINNQPRRLSFAPRRHRSVVMSREDILNNISMAGAALKSSLDFDSDLEDTDNEEQSPKKSARMSNKVVKTLHFHESISESSIHSETIISPLKKTAFGETSYMQERIYSPTKRDKHKHCTISSLDVTSKPTTKMQKLSESPDGSQSEKSEVEKQKKSPRKSKCKKPGTAITVQQLMTEYNVGPIDHATLDEQIKEVLRDPKSDNSSIEPTQSSLSDMQECMSLDMVSSFTSSKNLREGSGLTSQSSKDSRIDWQADSTDALSSKNLIECDSSVNVVAKIDMLPFMGSHECEWESSSVQTWTFHLLHARLRLIERLVHHHDNATPTRERADTPVKNFTLEVLPHDTENTIAALCVSFAAETMRYFISLGCSSAGDVTVLVKRCAATARLAAKWGRAMYEASISLAYCLTPDGTLTLKVANIPLRCLWEMTMRLELVVGEAREAPWVRAGGVRVQRVYPPCADEVRLPRVLKYLPRDWGHAPVTIWRIFKYLKRKTRDDNELFMVL